MGVGAMDDSADACWLLYTFETRRFVLGSNTCGNGGGVAILRCKIEPCLPFAALFVLLALVAVDVVVGVVTIL